MSEALQVKQICVDSSYRTADSVSDSNFRIQLGRNIYLPDNCIMQIENCVIPHSWYSIDTGIYDTMYLKVNSTYNIVIIPSANYTGNELTTALQAGLNVVFPGVFTVSYALNTNKISISSSSSFKLLTDSELAT